MAEVKDCPNCRLVNPPTAQRCDCGWDFVFGETKGGMLVAEYGAEGESSWRWVVIDPEAGTVTFHRCHQRPFPSCGADPEFTCHLSELQGVCWNHVRYFGEMLEVFTPDGSALLPVKSSGFEAVRAALVGGLSPEAKLRWYQYPAAWVLFFPPLFVVGCASAVLCAWAIEQRLVSELVLFWSLMGPGSLFIVIPVLMRMQGRSMW